MIPDILPSPPAPAESLWLVLTQTSSMPRFPCNARLRLVLECRYDNRFGWSKAAMMRSRRQGGCEVFDRELRQEQGREIAELVRWLGLPDRAPDVRTEQDPEWDYEETIDLGVRLGNRHGSFTLNLSPGYGGPDGGRVSSFFCALLQIAGAWEEDLRSFLVPRSGRAGSTLLGFCADCGSRVTPYLPRTAFYDDGGQREEWGTDECDSFHWCGRCGSVKLAPNLGDTSMSCVACRSLVPSYCRHCPACGAPAWR